MKKILVVVNGINPPTHVIAFAVKNAKENPNELFGIFVNGNTEPMSLQYPFPNDMALTEVPLTNERIEEENKKLLNSNIQLFKDECLSAGIACEVNTEFALKEILEQSSSAELIMADTNADFPHFSLKDILTDAHCPVFLVGIEAPVIEKVILAYDGHETSKYAIEKFKDIFPNFNQLPTFLVSINMTPMEILENKEYFNQWLPKHFSNLTIKELEGDIKDELLRFLNLHLNNTLIVMGAFGRGTVARFFHPSLANTVLHETKVSLFIGHN